MVERWQKDAEGIINFVCPNGFLHVVVGTDQGHVYIDRFILRHPRRTGRCISSGYQAQPAGYLVLSRENV